MKKFDRIKLYNRKYAKELDKSIKLIMPKIIEAFVHIYGEKHREYITSVLNSINFAYFISKEFLKIINKSNHISHRMRYISSYYLNYINYLNNMSDLEKDDPQYFLFSNLLVYAYWDTLNFSDAEIEMVVDEGKPFFTISVDDELNIRKSVYLPVYLIDFRTLLHEINHALSIDAMAITDEAIIMSSLFPVIEAEELVNDYIAGLVYEEFLRIGGVIPKTLNSFCYNNAYEYNSYIVEYFYDSLGPLILESLITKRFKLFDLAGKENLLELCNLMKDLFNNVYQEEKYQTLIDIIDRMYDNIINSKDIDYEGFYQELEKKGHTVRRLKK